MKAKTEVLIPRLNDLHVHFRGPEFMSLVLKFIGPYFNHTVAMWNKPWVETAKEAKYWYQLLDSACFRHAQHLRIINSVMLGQLTNPMSIKECFLEGAGVIKNISGSVGAGTHSISLFELSQKYSSLEKGAELFMPFSGHWELQYDKNGNAIPELEREKRAIPFAEDAIKALPGVIFVIEHITTKEMLDFVLAAPDNVFGTVRLQDLIVTYDDVYRNGKIYRPENFYWPVAKFQNDITALTIAITSLKNRKLFYGSDFAPHPQDDKALPNPKPGAICPSKEAIAKIWEIFLHKHQEPDIALAPFLNFMLYNGLVPYGIQRNKVDEQPKLKLIKKSHTVPKDIGGIPFLLGGDKLSWSLEKI